MGAPAQDASSAAPIEQQLLVSFGGKTYAVDAPLSGSLSELKEAIQDKTGVPPCLQKLVFNGRYLTEEAPLACFGLQHLSALKVELGLRGGAQCSSPSTSDAVASESASDAAIDMDEEIAAGLRAQAQSAQSSSNVRTYRLTVGVDGERFGVIWNEAGGDCLYRSTSQALNGNGNEDDHPAIRQAVVNLMRDPHAPYDFAGFAENDVDNDEVKFADYLKRMETLGEYGGDQEVLALALRYDRVFVVHDANLSRPREYPEPDTDLRRDIGEEHAPVHLYRTGSGRIAHYELMERVDSDWVSAQCIDLGTRFSINLTLQFAFGILRRTLPRASRPG